MFSKRDSQNSCEPALVDFSADRSTFVSSHTIAHVQNMPFAADTISDPSVIHVAPSKKLFLD